MDHISKKSNLGPWIFATVLVIVIGIIILVAMGNSSAQPSAASSSSNVSNSTSNLEAQNACIANAQAEVNNNPMYQPVGGDAESQSLAQQSKALAMQPKIAACKEQYPTN